MNNKDTIYIDIDDEITAIIDKVQNAGNKIVALVLPKRATVFQSIVNMKLLKRSAETAKKQVVLITSEAGLLPLAANVGLYVAKTLQSKPAIPTADDTETDDVAEEIDEPLTLDDDFDVKDNATTPVGVLNGEDSPAVLTEEPESIDMDEADEEAPTETPKDTPKADKAKNKKKPVSADGKKLAVPNFLRFRKRFILIAAALVILIVGGYVCAKVLPKATITIKADASTVVVDKTLTLSTQQKTVNSGDGILPAATQQVQKTNTQQASATGQKNLGDKATGEVTIKNCTTNHQSVSLPAGTGISSNGLTFITQKSVSLPLSGQQNNGCVTFNGATSVTVDVKAVDAGTQYNIGPSSFTVASSYGNQLTATSSDDFTGGTDNVVKVVSQADIDGAKQKLSSATTDSDAAKTQLQQQLTDAGYQAILETFVASDPNITTSANANDQTDSVTVTQTVTYKMYGVKKADLETLVSDSVNDKIDTNKQSILDDGLGKATYAVLGTPTDSSTQVKFRSEAIAGPKIDLNGLKKQLAGQKSGQIQSQLKTLPGVEDVTVKFSPFWVTSVPKDASKVTVNFEQVGGGATDGQ